MNYECDVVEHFYHLHSHLLSEVTLMYHINVMLTSILRPNLWMFVIEVSITETSFELVMQSPRISSDSLALRDGERHRQTGERLTPVRYHAADDPQWTLTAHVSWRPSQLSR